MRPAFAIREVYVVDDQRAPQRAETAHLADDRFRDLEHLGADDSYGDIALAPLRESLNSERAGGRPMRHRTRRARR
jgi:hypothetical protein